MTVERWLPIADAPGYEVSSNGRVKSSLVHRGREVPHLLAQRPHPQSGYLLVDLHGPAKHLGTQRVHKLVADAFLGPRPAGAHTRHLDGDQTNNVAANLSYGTASDNVFDMVRHGRHHMARRTHCKHGHEYTFENTRINARGARICRACARAYQRRVTPGVAS